MNEAVFQKQCITKARRRGWLVYKFASPSLRGVPDCIFIFSGIHGAEVVFIEFKNPNRRGKLSELQKRKIEELQNYGADIFVVDNMEDFDEIIKSTEHRAT